MSQIVRTIIIILSCTACGGLVRLYLSHQNGKMPIEATISTVLLFLYVVAEQAAHYQDNLSWYTFLALGGTIAANSPLWRHLKIKRNPSWKKES